MISEKMLTLGTKKSVIREIFEYSKKRAAEIGAENVFDFSIGNPNVPAPVSVHETIKELLDSKNDYYLFGYTSAQGDADTRAAVAADLNKRFGTAFHADNFYMTCGAAASLRIVLGALTVPGDEYIVFTPYFPEYRVFIESAGAAMIETPTLTASRPLSQRTPKVFSSIPRTIRPALSTPKKTFRSSLLFWKQNLPNTVIRFI